jgi:hypothetical protein
MEFHENPYSESRVVPCGQTTDRHDEANSCFSQFCELAKKQAASNKYTHHGVLRAVFADPPHRYVPTHITVHGTVGALTQARVFHDLFQSNAPASSPKFTVVHSL